MAKKSPTSKKEDKKKKKNRSNRSGWHQVLGEIWQEWLTPVDITVQTEVSVMAGSPKADIFLWRREGQEMWDAKQRERLPDGIRDSLSSHILIEFKMTQSVNVGAVLQTEGYDRGYLSSQKLKSKGVQSFLISSKTPSKKRLKFMEFEKTDQPGVYQGTSIYNRRVTLLVINQLRDTPNNAAIKIFASKQKEREKGFARFQQSLLKKISAKLEQAVGGLWKLFHKEDQGGFMKHQEISMEEINALGRDFILQGTRSVSPEEIVEVIGSKKLAKAIGTKQFVKDMDSQEVLSELGDEKIEAYLKNAKLKKKNLAMPKMIEFLEH